MILHYGIQRDDDGEDSRALGVQAFLMKPYLLPNHADLVRRVRDQLRGRTDVVGRS